MHATPRIPLALALAATLVGCGSDSDPMENPDAGEHVTILRGTLNDPATAKATHDMGAMGAEPIAASLGDLAHIVGLGSSVMGTGPNEWLVIDRWAQPGGIDMFYGDPGFQQGLNALVSSPTIEHFRREHTWYGWGDYDSGAGAPRWYVVVRGRLKDLATAQMLHDQGAAAAEPAGAALGDVAHLVFRGRDDDREFLAIDMWTSPTSIEAFYSDPGFAAAAAMLFEGTPTLSVYHATDWYQWGSAGKTSLDGRWQITAFSCAGQPQVIGDFTLEIRGPGGTFVQVFDPGCVATYDETYAYSSSDGFLITPDAITCDPSDSCAAIFGASCLPLPPPTTFTWALDGETLTFTRTAEGPGDLPCQPGDAVEFTMQRLAL